MSSQIVSADWKPPVGGMGGSVHDWERALSPWHADAFPDEFKDRAPEKGERKHGWMALDFWGNAIGFVADGTVWDVSPAPAPEVKP